jgi:hypothetical protein
MSDKLNAGEECGKRLQSVWDVCHRPGGGLRRLGTQYIAVLNPMKSWDWTLSMSLTAEPVRHTEYKDVKGPTRHLGKAGGKLFCLFGNFWNFLGGFYRG